MCLPFVPIDNELRRKAMISNDHCFDMCEFTEPSAFSISTYSTSILGICQLHMACIRIC